MYTEKHFAACVFNPMIKGKMLHEYPRINQIVEPEWAQDPWLDHLIRYVIMMYDHNSPLIKEERDLNYRKSLAAELANLDMQDQDYLAIVYTFTHDYLLELTCRFLMRFIKSKEFTAIVVIENCFWESVKKLMEPISGDNSKQELEAVQKKEAIKAGLDNDMARLEKYYKTFYGGDETLEQKSKGRLTPERLAGVKK